MANNYEKKPADSILISMKTEVYIKLPLAENDWDFYLRQEIIKYGVFRF